MALKVLSIWNLIMKSGKLCTIWSKLKHSCIKIRQNIQQRSLKEQSQDQVQDPIRLRANKANLRGQRRTGLAKPTLPTKLKRQQELILLDGQIVLHLIDVVSLLVPILTFTQTLKEVKSAVSRKTRAMTPLAPFSTTRSKQLPSKQVGMSLNRQKTSSLRPWSGLKVKASLIKSETKMDMLSPIATIPF